MGGPTSALRPPTTAAVARIPDVDTDCEVFRAQWDHHGPWWFSTRTGNSGAGRFDLESPHGTCYFADDAVAAIIGKLTDPGQLDPLIPAEELQRLLVWHGRLPSRWTVVADTTNRASGMPKELGVIVPYELPWMWADALHAARRSGLRYWLRLDPGSGRGIAVFADRGAPDPPPQLQHHPATRHLSELRASFDIIEPTPAFDVLAAADEP